MFDVLAFPALHDWCWPAFVEQVTVVPPPVAEHELPLVDAPMALHPTAPLLVGGLV